MKKNLIIIFLASAILGIYGFHKYTIHSCNNTNSINWQSHKLTNCSVYYNEGILALDEEGVDTMSFVKISAANIPTFTEFDKFYAKDKRFVYYKGGLVRGADPKSFVSFGGEYFVDKRNVFWRGSRISGADVHTFELFSTNVRYAKDAKNEFFGDVMIADAEHEKSNRILISPFNGDEVTKNKEREIFWRQSEISQIDSLSIVLVGDNGDFTWISDEQLSNTGTFEWLPSSATTSPDTLYKLVFYGHNEDGVTKFDLPNKFSVVKEGRPGVSLVVNFSNSDRIKVTPDDIVYIYWSASNVDKCYLAGDVRHSLVGYTTVRFPQVGDAKVTEYTYNVECFFDGEFVASDSVVIESSVSY